jgi:hypothetical protein
MKRLAVLIGTILAVLMAVGVGSAVVNANAGATTEAGPAESLSSTVATEASTVVYEASDAGTVTVASNGSSLEITDIAPADGWVAEIEVATGREVEADFRSGDRRIQFNAELEDGQIDARIRESVDGDNSGSDNSGSDNSGSDNSGSDNSGRGNSDDHPDDDDNSGRSGDDHRGTTTTMPGSTTTRAPAGSGTTAHQAGDGGTVTITLNGSTLTIVSVNPSAGWAHEIEVATGREVEVDFRNGDRRIQFDAEFEDGDVRIRVREKSD